MLFKDFLKLFQEQLGMLSWKKRLRFGTWRLHAIVFLRTQAEVDDHLSSGAVCATKKTPLIFDSPPHKTHRKLEFEDVPSRRRRLPEINVTLPMASASEQRKRPIVLRLCSLEECAAMMGDKFIRIVYAVAHKKEVFALDDTSWWILIENLGWHSQRVWEMCARARVWGRKWKVLG